MEFFDKSIMDGAVTPKNSSYSTDSSSEKQTNTVKLKLPLQNANVISDNNNDVNMIEASDDVIDDVITHDDVIDDVITHDDVIDASKTLIYSTSAPPSIRHKRNLQHFKFDRQDMTSQHMTSPHMTSQHMTSQHMTSAHMTSPHMTSGGSSASTPPSPSIRRKSESSNGSWESD